jgi:hypothetical protein
MPLSSHENSFDTKNWETIILTVAVLLVCGTLYVAQ